MGILVACKACGAIIAKDAANCPQCGSPTKKSGGCLRFIAGSFLGLVILGFIGAFLDDPEAPSQSGHSHSPPAPGPDSSRKHLVGDKVTFDDSEWVVVSARELGDVLSGSQFVDPKKSAGRFVYVSWKVTNTTDAQQQILFTPTLVDSRGREFEELDVMELYLPEGESGMAMEQLPAGLPKVFSAIYEIPANAANLKFQARSFAAFRTTTKAVSLGL